MQALRLQQLHARPFTARGLQGGLCGALEKVFFAEGVRMDLLLYLDQHRMRLGFVRGVNRQRLERRAGLRQRCWDSQRIDGMGGGCRHKRRKTSPYRLAKSVIRWQRSL